MADAPEYVKQAFERWVESWGWETEREFYPYNVMVYDVGESNEE